MKLLSAYLLTSVLGIIALAPRLAAQTAAVPSKPASTAAIDGIVIKEPGSEPVKKVLIELIAENQNAGGDYTAVTAADGSFHIEGILPGRYHLFAERTGLLEKEKSGDDTVGRVLALTAGQELKDVQIPLQASAVVRGRVTDEDGDPLANAQVNVMRRTFSTGHGRWEQAGSERTNDLGEYRVANLPAGNYYVCVNPPPDFRSLIEMAGKSSADSANSFAADKPAPPSYQPTYYPGTTDRSQASPIPLHAGDDFPMNFSLTPEPSLSIRGAVVNLPPRSSATIMLQSHDFNLVLSGAEMHKDGSFVIHDVAPGTYTILAPVENSPVPMMARQSLQVVSSVDGVRLAPQTGASIRGRLHLESPNLQSANSARPDLSQFFLTLHPSDGDEDALSMFLAGAGFNTLTRVAADGSFEWKNVPPGNYYVQFAGDARVNATGAAAAGDSQTGWFLKSVLTEGRDTADSGINVSGGMISLDLLASANGAVVEGVVTDHKGATVSNAVVVAVPEPRLRGRVDRYRKTVSDQTGRFVLRGIPPGDYTLFAWESVEADAYYDPEFLRSQQGQETALHLAEGDRKAMQLEAIPQQDDRP
jgi:Carboxypeptidase regulatory-like domain